MMAGNLFRDSEFSEPMKGIRESLAKSAAQFAQLSDPMKEIRESLAKSAAQFAQLNDPMKGIISESLAKSAAQYAQLSDPMKEISESLAKSAAQYAQLSDPMKGIISESLAKSAAQYAQLSDPMKEISESLAKSAAQYAQLSDPMKGIRELLTKMSAAQFAPLSAAMKGIRESLEPMPALNLDSILTHISKENWPLAYETLSNDITINSDSSITVDAVTLSYEEIQNIASEISEKAFGPSVKSLERAVAELVAAIQAIPNSAMQKLLTCRVFPILVALVFAIVNPIFDFHVKEYLARDKRQIEKQIRKHVVASINNAEQLSSYRLITASVLNVRSRPSNKASILGRLQFGQVVVLIERNKSWSLVAWSDDENGLQLQGWVFSRYLQKFR